MINSRILILLIGISLIVMISIISISNNNTDTAQKVMAPMVTPTAVVSGVTVDWGVHNERLMVVETLTTFNKGSNTFFDFLIRTNKIEELEGHPFHKRYIICTLIIDALNLYETSVSLWNPPESIGVYYELKNMKTAELYRIQTFKKHITAIQIALMNEDELAIKEGFKNLKEWSDSTSNKESTIMQQNILEELKINEDEVNFRYKDPNIPSVKLLDN